MRILSISFLSAVLLASMACSNQKQSPEELKDKTAEATKELKQNAKAVVEGVREGWSRDKPLNLNTASKEQLTSLPGITSDQAEAIIVARPYYSPNDLLKRKVLSREEYDKIADLVTTSGAKPNPGM
jgi:competence protein ComEA